MSSRNDRGGGGGRGGRGGGRGGGGGGGGRGGGHSGGGGSRSTDSAVMTTGNLISNAYRVNFDSKIVWYRTGLDFDTDSRRTRLAIFNAIKDQLSKDFDSLVFDGTVVYSRAALTDNKKMQTNVFGREHSVSTISSKPIGASPEDALSLWNILLRKVLESRGMARIYDNHFDLSRPMPLDERDANAKIEIYRGVLSEISQRFIGQKPGLYLSLDPAHKVVSTESILSLCERVKEKEAFIRAVRGKRVLTRHNYKAYGVEGVEYSMTPKSTFTMTNRKTGAEEKVTFEKYYKDQGVVIKNMSQPLLISTGRKRERIYLVPELCVFASVPASAKARLPQITSLKPAARAIRIAELLKHVTEVSTRKGALALKQFGLEIEPAVVPIASTRLATPTIVFAPKTQKTPTSGEWRNEAANVKFTHISSQKLAVYPVVLYDINMNLEQGFSITQYWADIKSSMNAMAAPLALQKDLLFPYKGSANTSMEAMLKIAQTKLPKDASANQVLVVAFISDDGRKDASKQYDEYRQYCLAHGFIGQAINVSSSHQKRKLDDRNRSSIVGNLARQIVNKFSHAAWWFNVPTILPKHSNKTFIFIGMDVFHAAPELIRVAKDEKDPSKKSEHAYWQKRSIVGYSAKFSTGVGVPLFYCDTETRDAGAEVEGQRTQSSKPSEAVSEAGSAHLRQTTSQQASSSSSSSAPGAAVPTGGLGKFLHDCLNHWKAYIKDPASLVVIVYRDGVADSQLDQVDESEVAQLKSVLPANAHAIYSVVQKRVHNRFMMSDAGKYGNCSGGTVVEDLARVSGGRYNFFLVPCATTLSTNKPVHYTITYDSKPGTISNTEFHALAFASHHTYQNWAGTVKVPDVCQNAHTLAYLLGESGVRDPVIPVNLKPSMFFL